jgi:hypothetical protein
MKCDRLILLIKNWYLKVQEEAMAPARMVTFMEQHISQCEICLADQDVKQEADKIREIVLPPSKVPKPKVVRVAKEEVEDAEKVENKTTEEDDEDIETAEDEVEDSDEDDVNGIDEEPDPDELDDDLI